MCGIVGLFLKDKALEPQLGALTNQMLGTMCDRGPDSAGFAVYGAPTKGKAKITVQTPNPEIDLKGLDASVGKAIGADVALQLKSSHAVLTVPEAKADAARARISTATQRRRHWLFRPTCPAPLDQLREWEVGP